MARIAKPKVELMQVPLPQVPTPIVEEYKEVIENKNIYGTNYRKVESVPSLFEFYKEGIEIFIRKLTTKECKQLSDASIDDIERFEEIMELINFQEKWFDTEIIK